MQFTPQQLAGAQRYGPQTRVGNWLEDTCLDESKIADFRKRKEQGSLTMGFTQAKMALCNQPVPHSYSSDGKLRFGDTVVVVHQTSNAALASDLFDEISFGSKEYLVTASPNTAPTARTTFVIDRAQESKEADDSDDVLYYGMPFALRCNDSLLVDKRINMLKAPFYLASTLKNERQGSRVSNRQLAYMTPRKDSKATWCVQKLAASDPGVSRLLSKEEPVPANAPLVLQHRGTFQTLSCDPKHVDSTDFGPEFEVCCHNNLGTGKIEALSSEFSGRATAQTNVRLEQHQNYWLLTTAADAGAARETRALPPKLTTEALLSTVRNLILKRTKGSFRGLRKAFQIMDDGRDLKLDREDLKWGLYDIGISLEDDQFNALMDLFDRNKDGLVSLTEFLTTIRGDMNATRMQFVELAFGLLDKDGSGKITKEDLAGAYDFSQNPEVISGEMTEDDAAMLFLSNFERSSVDGVVTMAEFVEYYRDISAEIDDDEYFELMMRNAWHISGGEGAAANSSCLRMLVIHTDDSMEVVELTDDLGLDVDDIDAIVAKLEAQGVTDIKAVDTHGGV